LNGEENVEEKKTDIISYISRLLPAVEKPLYKQSFNTRMKWTGVALLLYLILSFIGIYGISATSKESLRFYEILMGAKFGSLMTLGIGPIVTAGIILQLLVGSKILKWDMTRTESRRKFQLWDKILAIAFSFIEATAYILAGAVQVIGGGPIIIFAIFQLALGGIIVIFLDELVTKWGFGSGVSLFIAAGVTMQILIGALSPFAGTCKALYLDIASCLPSEANPPSGYLWKGLIDLLGGNFKESLVSFTHIFSTIMVFLVVVYAQGIKVDVPLAFSALRGFGRNWSLKLFYTSNIPVILAAALLANFQLMGRFGIAPDQFGNSCGPFGCFNQQGQAISGIVYFLSSPRNLLVDVITQSIVPIEILRAISYLIVLTAMAVMFSVFWVNTSGMDPKSVAEQIEGIGMQIPGYRRDPRIVESVLKRYIPALAVLGGLAIGLLAAFADFTGALGTGTGILLTVMIIYNYYEELSNQNLEEAHPIFRKILGEE